MIQADASFRLQEMYRLGTLNHSPTANLRRQLDFHNKPTNSHGVGFVYHTVNTAARPSVAQLLHGGKGPDGSGAVAKRQACYDGAVGARGIHELRSFGVEDPQTFYPTHRLDSHFTEDRLRKAEANPDLRDQLRLW